jgi:hypothetical protein
MSDADTTVAHLRDRVRAFVNEREMMVSQLGGRLF